LRSHVVAVGLRSRIGVYRVSHSIVVIVVLVIVTTSAFFYVFEEDTFGFHSSSSADYCYDRNHEDDDNNSEERTSDDPSVGGGVTASLNFTNDSIQALLLDASIRSSPFISVGSSGTLFVVAVSRRSFDASCLRALKTSSVARASIAAVDFVALSVEDSLTVPLATGRCRRLSTGHLGAKDTSFRARAGIAIHRERIALIVHLTALRVSTSDSREMLAA